MSRLHVVLVPPRSGFPSGFCFFFPGPRLEVAARRMRWLHTLADQIVLARCWHGVGRSWVHWGIDDEYSPNPRYMDAVQVQDASVNWLKNVSPLSAGAGGNSIVPLELRVALGFCSFIPPGWRFSN